MAVGVCLPVPRAAHHVASVSVLAFKKVGVMAQGVKDVLSCCFVDRLLEVTRLLYAHLTALSNFVGVPPE